MQWRVDIIENIIREGTFMILGKENSCNYMFCEQEKSSLLKYL